MSLPIVSDPPWGLVEWGVTGISTLAVSAAAFVWRLLARVERMSVAVDRQRTELDRDKRESDLALDRLSARFAQIHTEHCQLQIALSALPTRGDLRDLDERIGERIDALAARIDRALEMRGI